ncbi:MAG TPA: DUF1622 domain-containing protein [Candidatus Omnitrophota bacterium]|nr:DUF1622 domain-containing protein [Candidatus Omnitrophota bacterium]
MQAINIISLGIGSFGVIVIIWGSLVSAIEFCAVELKRFSGDNSFASRALIRQHLGFYLLMGLEFMIGADIVRTLIRPSLQELAVLGSMVAIRTVISFFLNKEMSKCKTDKDN